MKPRSTSFILSTTAVTLAAFALAGCDRGADSNTGGTPGSSATVGTAIDDTVLTTNVKTALMASENVRSLNIDVETDNGVVQLSGEVGSQAQVDQALMVARSISGVREVQNRLTIKPAGTGTVDGSATLGTAVDDTAVTARVKSALLADPEVSGLAITVETTNGVVQLSGNVASQAQIAKAEQVARAAEGAGSVQNQLKVAP